MGVAGFAETIRFEDFEFDLESGVLRRAGVDVAISRLTRRLLWYLAENRDRVVSFAEVRDEAWEGAHVSDAAVHQAFRQLRRTLGDDGSRQRVVKTVRGLGYRFVAPTSSELPEETGSQGLRSYIGRGTLLGALRRQLEESLAGSGRLVLLGGEPGVGKTRTAEELMRAAREQGALVVSAGRGSRSGAPPYWAWSALFAALALRRPVVELRREIDELAPRFLNPEQARNLPANEDELGRFRLFDAAARCLARAAELGPLVLWFDDLHDLDRASVELLEYVAQEVRDDAILLLCAYRPEQAFDRSELAEPLGRLVQQPGVSRFEVLPLGDAETQELIRSHDPPTHAEEFLQTLSRSTQGNPFYAIELMRHMSLRVGSADLAEIVWSEHLPEGVEHVLAARLIALSSPALRLLSLSACLGLEFDLEILGAIEPAPDVASGIREARALGLVLGRSDAPRLAHPLIREAVVAQLLRDPHSKRQLHLEIGEAIIRAQPYRVAEAAFHLAAAAPLGDRDRTLGFLTRAAELAERSLDDDQAAALYDQALRLLARWEDVNDEVRCRLLVCAGEVAVRGTRADRARGHLREAVAVARGAGLSELFCRAALGLAYRDEILGLAETDVAALLEEGLEEHGAVADDLRVRLLSALARKVRYERGALARAQSLSDESVRLAKATDSAASLARVLEDASFVRWSVEDPERWIDLNHGIVEAASEARDLGLLLRGAKGLATGYLEIGDRDACEREIERCGELANQAPAPFPRAIFDLQRGALAMLDGRFSEGEEYAIAVLQSGLPSVTQLASVQLFYHRLETGRVGELENSVRSLVESAPGIGGWSFALARLLVELDRKEEARQQLAATESLARLPRDRNWLAAGVMGAETAVRIGDVDRCRELYEALAPYARVNVVLGHGSLFFGSTSHFLGSLASALGDAELAQRHLETALVMHERMRSQPWCLRSRAELAFCAAGPVGSGEMPPEVVALVEEAASLGMIALDRQIRSRLGVS